MHFRLAEPKKEVDTLVLDKTPGYEISCCGDLGTTNRNRTFLDVQDTKKGPLKSLGEEELSPNDDEAPEDPEQDTDRDVELSVRSASYLGRRA